jgi:hypothetical protein
MRAGPHVPIPQRAIRPHYIRVPPRELGPPNGILGKGSIADGGEITRLPRHARAIHDGPSPDLPPVRWAGCGSGVVLGARCEEAQLVGREIATSGSTCRWLCHIWRRYILRSNTSEWSQGDGGMLFHAGLTLCRVCAPVGPRIGQGGPYCGGPTSALDCSPIPSSLPLSLLSLASLPRALSS